MQNQFPTTFRNISLDIQKKIITYTALLLTSTLLFSCGAQHGSQDAIEKASGEKYVDHFAENGFSIPLTSFVYPSGEYYQGVTYVAYQGLLEDPYIAAYNHKTASWTGPFKLGVSDMGKDPKRRKRIDNHGQPALIIDDEGYIHIVFGGHGGTPEIGENTLGNHNYGRTQHMVSKRPLDITDWEPLENISPFGTYTQWVKMDNGDLYLFYRHGAHKSNWVYQKSTDNGRSFTPPISILETRVSSDFKGSESWYGWFTKAEGDKIIVTINFHECRTGQKGIHRGERHDAYYMYMDTKEGVWRNIHNEILTMPLNKNTADDKIFAWDSGDHWTHTEAVKLDSEGNPHMTIRHGEDNGSKHGGPKQMHYMRWNGKKWVETKDKNLPISKGDIKVISPTEVELWLQSRYDDGSADIAVWRSTNAGENFKKEKVLLESDTSGFIISSFIRNAHPSAQLIAAEVVNGTDLRRMYLVGEDGPIKRLAEEVK